MYYSKIFFKKMAEKVFFVNNINIYFIYIYEYYDRPVSNNIYII